MPNPKLSPSARLLEVATEQGWRAKLHGESPDGWPMAALYDSLGEYVGLVCVMHNALITHGEWDLNSTRSFSRLRKAYDRAPLVLT